MLRPGGTKTTTGSGSRCGYASIIARRIPVELPAPAGPAGDYPEVLSRIEEWMEANQDLASKSGRVVEFPQVHKKAMTSNVRLIRARKRRLEPSPTYASTTPMRPRSSPDPTLWARTADKRNSIRRTTAPLGARPSYRCRGSWRPFTAILLSIGHRTEPPGRSPLAFRRRPWFSS